MKLMLLGYSMLLSDDSTGAQKLNVTMMSVYLFIFFQEYTSWVHMWFLEACINK